MALADALADATRKPGPSCSFGRLTATLSTQDKAALDKYMGDAAVASAAIARALQAEGINVKRDTVRRHRIGECACGSR